MAAWHILHGFNGAAHGVRICIVAVVHKGQFLPGPDGTASPNHLVSGYSPGYLYFRQAKRHTHSGSLHGSIHQMSSMSRYVYM